MAKNAVFRFANWYYPNDDPLRELAIYFDKIYMPSIEVDNLIKAKHDIEFNYLPSYQKEMILTMDRLCENQIIIPYTWDEYVSALESLEKTASQGLIEAMYEYCRLRDELDTKISEYKHFRDVGDVVKMVDGATDETIARNKFGAHYIRLSALVMALTQTDSDFFPFMNYSHLSSNAGNKEKVVQYILHKMPKPSEKTSWEQIIEFRSDVDTRNKYLALINWINKVSASSSSLSEINDEYEYLYSEYMKAFNLHQLKYNLSMVEIVVSAGVDFLTSIASGHYIPAVKNLLSMKLSQINLMQEEGKLPGKEIAYIYHAEQALRK
jgi:hypothetical protein